MKCSAIPCSSRASRFPAWPLLCSNRSSAVKLIAKTDELVLHSALTAPVEDVFRYWTSPGHLARWWSPCPVPADHNSLNATPGGTYRVCIRTHDGDEHWLRGVYHTVDAPRLLSFSWAWEADVASPVSTVTVRFTADGNHTQLLLRHAGFGSPRARVAHQAGWEECFERLQALSASDNQESSD